tara:strand:- start:207 stop:1019 length:813 start_codon:yes stop_codon:yes gene_type:complete
VKLSVSNIAWDIIDEKYIFKELSKYNVLGIEVAPTKIWPEWSGANLKNAKKYKEKLYDYGLSIPALQSILYEKNNLNIFNISCYTQFFDHFKLLCEVASGLGAKVLVFGSPKNRYLKDIKINNAYSIAKDFFIKAAEICKSYNIIIGIEPNPQEYNCNFITDPIEAIKFVKYVDHPYFMLHLDSAAILMSEVSFRSTFKRLNNICHYHISAPYLKPVIEKNMCQKSGLIELKKYCYDHWVSIEMAKPNDNKLVLKSVRYISSLLKMICEK